MRTIAKVKCSCVHEAQDKLHGVHTRIANLKNKSVKKDSTQVDVTCTVCKKIHTVSKGNLK